MDFNHPYVEIECESCHVTDIIYLSVNPEVGSIIEPELNGWTSCLNSCCWLCKDCRGKNPKIFVEKVRIKVV